MTEPVPRWFRKRIIEGLRALTVLRLPAMPDEETAEYTRDVWVRTLWDTNIQWAENLDSSRIEQAFTKLCRTVDRWPAPRHLLDALPARREPKALPGPSLTAEQREANRARLRAMLQEALGNG